jgi:hypothetical protein
MIWFSGNRTWLHTKNRTDGLIAVEKEKTAFDSDYGSGYLSLTRLLPMQISKLLLMIENVYFGVSHRISAQCGGLLFAFCGRDPGISAAFLQE